MAEQRELIARLEQDLSTIQSIQRPDAEVSPSSTPSQLPPPTEDFLWVLPAYFTMKAQSGCQSTSQRGRLPRAGINHPVSWLGPLPWELWEEDQDQLPLSQQEDLRPQDHGRLEPKGPLEVITSPPLL